MVGCFRRVDQGWWDLELGLGVGVGFGSWLGVGLGLCFWLRVKKQILCLVFVDWFVDWFGVEGDGWVRGVG